MASKKISLRARLLDMPQLNETGLRLAQIKAINNLELSFKKNKPKALIQMATGAGKTFPACTFVYRLLEHAKAKRILFLVDTKNLGEQAEQEFMAFQPNDSNRKFTEFYNVQRLISSYIASDSQVCISTIQRMYAILKGEELDKGEEETNPNESTWMEQQRNKKQAMPVEYSAKVPIEQFDFIVIDECHRSIYNLWKQVLDYFDAFLIGLTATPDKRTFGFFEENVVSEYTYEESVLDGVNVPYDVYNIETEISQKGSVIKADWFVDRRDKLTRPMLCWTKSPPMRLKTHNRASLTALVSLIRRACGIDKVLKPFDTTIDENFKNWIFKQNAGKHNRFTPEKMDWLGELKNHVVNSYHIEIEDLDYAPFDEKGGRGRMFQLFGAEMNDIINELNEVLAA